MVMKICQPGLMHENYTLVHTNAQPGEDVGAAVSSAPINAREKLLEAMFYHERCVSQVWSILIDSMEHMGIRCLSGRE